MKTKIQIESFVGDCFKVLAYQIDHLREIDDLQCDEILAMIEGRIGALNEKPQYAARPKGSTSFLASHNSDNEYTHTNSKRELCAGDRLEVIEVMAKQMISHDKLKPSDVVKGCESYIRMHHSDGEDAPDLPKRPPQE